MIKINIKKLLYINILNKQYKKYRTRKKGIKKEVWFSICSRHPIYVKDCDMCNKGSWNNIVKYKTSCIIYRIFPSIWRWYVNK